MLLKVPCKSQSAQAANCFNLKRKYIFKEHNSLQNQIDSTAEQLQLLLVAMTPPIPTSFFITSAFEC